MGVDVEVQQAKTILVGSVVGNRQLIDMPVDEPGSVDVSYDIEIGIELPSIRVADAPFTGFPPSVEPPIFLADQMKDAILALETAVEDVDERLERLERVEGKLGDFVFLLFSTRIVCSNTMIH